MRVVRVLTYEGEPDKLLPSLDRVGVPLNGTKRYAPQAAIHSIIVKVEDGQCLLCRKATSNLTLICDICTRIAAIQAEEDDR